MQFSLNKIESERLDEWISKKDLTKPTGCSGGRFSYIFTPTTVGRVVHIRDNVDHDEIDVTDYDVW